MKTVEDDLRSFAVTPVTEKYAVSVQVVLWNPEHTHVCLVLDQGGIKTRRGVTHEKPRGYGNAGGAISVGETPYEGAIREVEQETNHMRKTFRIDPLPGYVHLNNRAREKEGRIRYKVIFVGYIIDPTEPLTDSPIKDPAGGDGSGVIFRRWVNYNDLPGMEEVMSPEYRFFGEPIYRSHLGNIYMYRGEGV